jgi:hypothetical protein
MVMESLREKGARLASLRATARLFVCPYFLRPGYDDYCGLRRSPVTQSKQLSCSYTHMKLRLSCMQCLVLALRVWYASDHCRMSAQTNEKSVQLGL